MNFQIIVAASRQSAALPRNNLRRSAEPPPRRQIVVRFATFLLLVSVFSARAIDITPYAWQFSAISNLTGADDLTTELQEHIDAVLTNGHLAPLYISRADQQSAGYAIYLEPGRIITSLAFAYPHVTAAQQNSIRSYVASELADSRFAPWST